MSKYLATIRNIKKDTRVITRKHTDSFVYLMQNHVEEEMIFTKLDGCRDWYVCSLEGVILNFHRTWLKDIKIIKE